MSDLGTNAATIKYFWRHMMRYPLLAAGMWLVMPVAILFNRFLPALVVAGILSRLAEGDFTPGDVWGSFGPQILLAIGLAALGGIFIWRIVSYCNWKLEGYVKRDIAREVFDHLMKLDANFHANSFAGSLVSQTNKLIGAYIRITDTTLFQVGTLTVSVLLTSILLYSRAPAFVALLILLVLIYTSGAFLITRHLRRLNAREAGADNKQTGNLADSVTNVMAVKSFAAGAPENTRFAAATEKTRQAQMSLMRATLKREFAFTSTNNTIYAASLILAVAGVVVWGAEIGTVFLIWTYAGAIMLQLWDFSNNTLRNFNRGFGDAKSMMEILALEPEVKDPIEPEPARIKNGAITFAKMDFTHPDSAQGETLFSSLNLKIKAGEKIGLVGHSGSGKSTLTRLLLRFHDLDGGAILIDNQNIAKIAQDDLRRHIAYVPQEPLLFHRTIRENIAFGQPDAADQDVTNAAKKAHALEFIEKLPKGFETLVGERGVKLSGGQRQRIAIARAILKDAPILVLDEATSALDSENEKLIQAALWELMKDRTAIVIAHRLSTIQRMDRIVVLEDGKIVEQDSHEKLLKQDGTYAKLWQHQSGGFISE
jgi:ATP-binding cassette subfamily B protein